MLLASIYLIPSTFFKLVAIFILIFSSLTSDENLRYIYHLTVGGFALVFPLNGVNEYEDEVDSQTCDFGSDGTKINLRATIYRFCITIHLYGYLFSMHQLDFAIYVSFQERYLINRRQL